MSRTDTTAILEELDEFLACHAEATFSDAAGRVAARLDSSFPLSDAGIPIAEVEADRKRIDAAYERFLLRYAEWMKAVG